MSDIRLKGKLSIPTENFAVLIDKTVVNNGTYNANDDDADGYKKVVVALPLGTKNITQNGTYEAVSDNVRGYTNVTVNVTPTTMQKNITQNGTYTASDDNVQGYSKVVVDVAQPNLITKDIYVDGTYNASDDNADGYSSVTVAHSTLYGGVDGYNELGIVNTTTLEDLILKNTVQNDMTVTVTNGVGINVAWRGGINIGVALGGNLNLNKCHKIKYTIVAQNAYYDSHREELYKIRIGVRRNKTSSNWNDFLKDKAYGITNATIEDELDISDLTGDFYLGMILSGYNLQITKLDFE